MNVFVYIVFIRFLMLGFGYFCLVILFEFINEMLKDFIVFKGRCMVVLFIFRKNKDLMEKRNYVICER